jgi:hypothetical protein
MQTVSQFYCGLIVVAAGPWPVINNHIHPIFDLQTRQGRAATRLAWRG